MAVLDEDFGTDLTLVEGSGGVRLCSVSVPERAPRDWRSQCERERARADAAEAHAEELRWAEVASRRRCRFVEVAVHGLPAQVERGRRGDEGSSPRGKGRALLAGRSGAP